MGWFFRRSAKFGPFRLNFSKSGIGVSGGIRGARVSTGPKGTYVNVGRNGFYYRQKIDGRYSATSSGGGATQSRISNDRYVTPLPRILNHPTLPRSLNYPTFPKHGPPRIVTSLGLLSIPVVVILVWILALIGANSNGSTAIGSGDKARPLAETTGSKPVESSRNRGFQAGFNYALRTRATTKSKSLNQRRVKKLATQMSETQHEDQEWQQGWIEGYKKAFNSSVANNANDNKVAHNTNSSTSVRGQTTSQQLVPIPLQPLRRSASNGYIRGPRGGCYYLSGSGRKVYVDRGLCN